MFTFLSSVKFSSRKCEGANGNKALLFTKTKKGLMSVCQYTTILMVRCTYAPPDLILSFLLKNMPSPTCHLP